MDPTTNGALDQCLLRLDTLPLDAVVLVVDQLDLSHLAHLSLTCHALYAAVRARADAHWKRRYKCLVGCTPLPLPWHIDHERHGKDARWLCVAMRTSPPTMARCNPRTNRLVGWLRSADGKTTHRGDFGVVDVDSATGAARIALDGYGARITESSATADSSLPPMRTIVEGVWRGGEPVGPCRVTLPECTIECSAWSPGGAAGTCTARWLNGSTYQGNMQDQKRDGFGIHRQHTGETWVGEWRADVRHGRAISPQADGAVRAGQWCDGSSTRRAVTRWPDGHVTELFGGDDSAQSATSGGTISRAGNATASRNKVTRAANNAAVCFALTVDSNQALSLTTAYEVTQSHVRMRCANGDVVIGGRQQILFLAVADDCPDGRLAGVRLWGGGFDSKDAPLAPSTKGIYFDDAPWALDSHAARLFLLYLESDATARTMHWAADIATKIREKAAQAGVSLAWRDDHDEAFVAARAESLGVPCGEAIAKNPAALGVITSPTWCAKGVCVRCFLSGALIPGGNCVLLASGRAYESDIAMRWLRLPYHGRHDPETDEPLAPPDFAVPWCAWMGDVPVAVLRTSVIAVAHDAETMRSLELAHPRLNTKAAHHDAIRLRVAMSLGCGRERTLAECLATLAYRDTAHHDDGALVRGFDFMSLAHVELRHPEWDARGPWRLGTPSCPPDDPTLDAHELAPPVGADRATAYLESHGVSWLALESPSFIGARLVGVFFFGQHFVDASFAGASLDRCVFVGCHFARVQFDGALCIDCAFYDCTLVDAPDRTISADSATIIRRINSRGCL